MPNLSKARSQKSGPNNTFFGSQTVHQCDEAGPVTYCGSIARVHCSLCGRVVIGLLLLSLLGASEAGKARGGQPLTPPGGYPGASAEENSYDPIFEIVSLVVLTAFVAFALRKPPSNKTKNLLARRRALLASEAGLRELAMRGDTEAYISPSFDLGDEEGYRDSDIDEAIELVRELDELQKHEDRVSHRLGGDSLGAYQRRLLDLFVEEEMLPDTADHPRLLANVLIRQLQDFRSVEEGELRITAQKALDGYVAQQSVPRHVRLFLQAQLDDFVRTHVPRPLQDFQK